MNIQLSAIKYVNPDKLKPNLINDKYFRPVTAQELDAMADDIKKRGVLVPLIAKKDGTLLAGHRRKFIAETVGLKTVPVQYVENDLTEAEETAFILKDNLFRRHLTPEERRLLYNQVCRNFEDKVSNKHSRTCGISSRELAEKTGLSQKTINYDLSAIRLEKEKQRINKSVVDIANESEIAQYKKATARMLNVAGLGSIETCREYLKIIDDAGERIKTIMTNIEIRAKGKAK